MGKFLFSFFGGTVLLLGSVFFMGGVVEVVGWVLGSTKVIFCSWVKFSGEFLGGWGFFSGGIVPLLGSIWWWVWVVVLVGFLGINFLARVGVVAVNWCSGIILAISRADFLSFFRG